MEFDPPTCKQWGPRFCSAQLGNFTESKLMNKIILTKDLSFTQLAGPSGSANKSLTQALHATPTGFHRLTGYTGKF